MRVTKKDPTDPRKAVAQNDPREYMKNPTFQAYLQPGYVALLDMLGVRDYELTERLGGITDYLTENEYTGPALQQAFDAIAPYAYENIRPNLYPTTQNILMELVRSFTGDRKNLEPVHDPQGRPVAAEEAYLMALGLPSDAYYFEDSEYKPAKSTDPNAQYKRLRRDMFDMQKINEIAYDMAQNNETSAAFSGFGQLLKEGVLENLGIDPFQNYTVSLGEDEQGKYLSYYDKYDFEGPLNSFTRPFETYDRFYYDPDYESKLRAEERGMRFKAKEMMEALKSATAQ